MHPLTTSMVDMPLVWENLSLIADGKSAADSAFDIVRKLLVFNGVHVRYPDVVRVLKYVDAKDMEVIVVEMYVSATRVVVQIAKKGNAYNASYVIRTVNED